jgi:regulator of sigma E protease
VNFLFTVAVLLLVLGVLIFVHELGHFLAAKWAGIRVHRFALGMGNPVPGLSFRRGHTVYAICWAPIGGYVKMATREEEVTSSALEGAAPEEPVPPEEMFEAKPLGHRIIVILAGVTMNVLFAFLAFTWVKYHYGEAYNPVTTIGAVFSDSLPPVLAPLGQLRPGDRIVAINGDSIRSWEQVADAIVAAAEDSVVIDIAGGKRVALPVHRAALTERVQAAVALAYDQPAVIGQLTPGDPGERAGFAIGDTILRVDGDSVGQWWDLVRRIRGSPGQELGFRVARGGRTVELRATPAATEEKGPGGTVRRVGKLGIGIAPPESYLPYSLAGAFAAGWRQTLSASTQIVRTVHGLFSARISSREVGGPILIGQLAAQSARLGAESFVSFMALISVNLAVLNLLPIPVLDGGQLVFLLAEGVLRRPLSLKLRERLTLVGLLLLALLMVLAFSNDIRRLLS